MNYFQAKGNNPFHLSVGAVVIDSKGEVCTHYFKSFEHANSEHKIENFYLLMRETIEPNESIEECLHRGLMEEFGMIATLERSLGSIVSHFKKSDLDVEKTTLYFLCKFVSQDDTKRLKDDAEKDSIITWVEPSILIEKMRDQAKRLNREDADESIVIERYLELHPNIK